MLAGVHDVDLGHVIERSAREKLPGGRERVARFLERDRRVARGGRATSERFGHVRRHLIEAALALAQLREFAKHKQMNKRLEGTDFSLKVCRSDFSAGYVCSMRPLFKWTTWPSESEIERNVCFASGSSHSIADHKELRATVRLLQARSNESPARVQKKPLTKWTPRSFGPAPRSCRPDERTGTNKRLSGGRTKEFTHFFVAFLDFQKVPERFLDRNSKEIDGLTRSARQDPAERRASP